MDLYAGLVRLGMASAGSWRCHTRSGARLDFKGVFVNVRVFKIMLFGSVAWLTLSAAWLAIGLGASSLSLSRFGTEPPLWFWVSVAVAGLVFAISVVGCMHVKKLGSVSRGR